MLTIISPQDFRQIPWKNGKGITQELAINQGASLADFDWRLSIATVSEDGPFSDFSGYWRNLFLLEGAGITLHHHNHHTDRLGELLSVASFDGQWQTDGQLHSGPIKDFNLMTRKELFQVNVKQWQTPSSHTINTASFVFVYSPTSETHLVFEDGTIEFDLPPNHLAQIENTFSRISVEGEMVITIALNRLAD